LTASLTNRRHVTITSIAAASHDHCLGRKVLEIRHFPAQTLILTPFSTVDRSGRPASITRH
jgi:hypothetical protein